MENAPVIAGLLEKRAEIEREIAELDRQIRKHKADRGQLDATIGLFSLTRRCQTALREAQGRGITADEIAVPSMADKRLDMAIGSCGPGSVSCSHGRSIGCFNAGR